MAKPEPTQALAPTCRGKSDAVGCASVPGMLDVGAATNHSRWITDEMRAAHK